MQELDIAMSHVRTIHRVVSRLAGTNCIFIWHEARDEGGMRGTYLPLIPHPPPRPNLDRPV